MRVGCPGFLSLKRMRALVPLTVIGFVLAGCSPGTIAGGGLSTTGKNGLFIGMSCDIHGTCRGVISASLNRGSFVANGNNVAIGYTERLDGTDCLQNPCAEGGQAHICGTGTYAGQPVTYAFDGTDPDPATRDSYTLTVGSSVLCFNIPLSPSQSGSLVRSPSPALSTIPSETYTFTAPLEVNVEAGQIR